VDPVNYLEVLKPSILIVAGVVLMLVTYFLFRWKAKKDLADMDGIRTDRMRQKIELLAAEKLAQRKEKPSDDKSEAGEYEKTPEPDNGNAGDNAVSKSGDTDKDDESDDMEEQSLI